MPTHVIYPTATITGNWETQVPGSGSHHEKIDEGTTVPDDADYVESSTPDAVDQFELGNTPDNTEVVDQIAVRVRAQINDADAYIRCELFHTSGTPLDDNPQDIIADDLGGTGILATATKTWAVDLTKAEADSLELRITHKVP